MNELARKKCVPCEGGIAALALDQVRPLLKGLGGWELVDGNDVKKGIAKTYRFKNYFETMAFVNAAAWVSHREDHHPDMLVGYNQCRVSYVTHAIDGLSENDFICAAKLDALFEI
jgi:4a-hydroxytetrahydrobiopterin dehydratase